MNSNVTISLDTRRQKADGTYPIILRLSHNRKTVGISTGYSIPVEFWDTITRKVKKGCPAIENITRVNNFLDKERSRALDVITKLADHDELRFLSIAELKALLEKKDTSTTFFAYTAALVEALQKQNRIGTATYYNNVLREVKNFRNKKDFTFRELTYAFLTKFESYYLAKGLETNGLNVYMRGIKAIYNRAVKDKLVDKEHYPFENYTIKNKPTRKRAIGPDAMRQLLALDLKPGSALYNTRHLFFLSLSAWGASFIDLAFLKISNFSDGRLQYKRRKTGKFYDIPVDEDAWPIIQYFAAGRGQDEFLLPIIKTSTLTEQYKNVLAWRKKYNKRLKKLGEMAGISEKLTSYVSRHSFASIANEIGVPLSAIGDMMGHTHYTTTQVYLASLQRTTLDKYSTKIMAAARQDATKDIQDQ